MYEGRTIIDVRTKLEYKMGHIEGSINIPMNKIPEEIESLKKYDNPIFCCASGHRSQQVVDYLKSQGINCENGGGWKEVKSRL